MKKTKKAIQKNNAAVAASAAWGLIYEVQTLHEIAQFLQTHHGEGCSDGANQVRVLASIAEEKLDETLFALSHVNDYFTQGSTPAQPTAELVVPGSTKPN